MSILRYQAKSTEVCLICVEKKVHKMNDLFSAVSLLCTVTAFLYGLWYGDISEQILKDWNEVTHREFQLKKLLSIIWGRAFPLAFGSLLVAGVFIPEFIKLWKLYPGFKKMFLNYNTCHAAFFVAVLLLLAISTHSWIRFIWLLRIYIREKR